jgi:hypothetical protein
MLYIVKTICKIALQKYRFKIKLGVNVCKIILLFVLFQAAKVRIKCELTKYITYKNRNL